MGSIAGIPYRRTESRPRSQEVRRGAQASPRGIVDAGALAAEGCLQHMSRDGLGDPVPGGPRHLREQLDARRQERIDRMQARWANEAPSAKPR